MIRRLLAVAAMVAAVAAPALASNLNFTLNNKTSHTLVHLYVAPHSQDHWGPDILGKDTLESGAETAITFDRDASEDQECQWDIRGTFSDGGEARKDNVDLCTIGTFDFTD
jgi:hypothetical protein